MAEWFKALVLKTIVKFYTTNFDGLRARFGYSPVMVVILVEKKVMGKVMVGEKKSIPPRKYGRKSKTSPRLLKKRFYSSLKVMLCLGKTP
jgi:hypothetical protein